MLNQKTPDSRIKTIALMAALELVATSLIITNLYWFYKIIPKYAQMYEGMGPALPAISKFVFSNSNLSGLPLIICPIFFAALHIVYLRTLKVAKIAFIAFSVVASTALFIMWYATNAPLWQLKQVIR